MKTSLNGFGGIGDWIHDKIDPAGAARRKELEGQIAKIRFNANAVTVEAAMLGGLVGCWAAPFGDKNAKVNELVERAIRLNTDCKSTVAEANGLSAKSEQIQAEMDAAVASVAKRLAELKTLSSDLATARKEVSTFTPAAQ